MSPVCGPFPLVPKSGQLSAGRDPSTARGESPPFILVSILVDGAVGYARISDWGPLPFPVDVSRSPPFPDAADVGLESGAGAVLPLLPTGNLASGSRSHPDIGQGWIPEEPPDGLWEPLEAFQTSSGDSEQLGPTLDSPALDVVVLHVLPHPLVGIELGRVAGQEEQFQSTLERGDVV